MVTDNDFLDLQDRFNALKLTVDTLLQNGLSPMLMVPGTMRFGGDKMEVGNSGVIFQTNAATPLGSLYWPGPFPSGDPSLVYPRGEISGYSNATSSALVQMLAYRTSATYAQVYAYTGIASNPQVNALSITPSYQAGIATVALESSALAAMEMRGSLWQDITVLTQISANTNDYAVGAAYRSAVGISSDAARDITGILATGVNDGAFLFILNRGSFNITLKDSSASSSAANRFALDADIVLKPDQGCFLMYDSASTVWRAIAYPSAGGSVATDAIWDAKGDLAVGTGADTAQKLTAAGFKGRFLQTDSAQTTGLKWNTLNGNLVTQTSGSLAAAEDNDYIRCDASSGSVTINLPQIGGGALGTGKTYLIKRVDTSGNTVTIDAQGSQTIDGSLTITLAPYEAVMLIAPDSGTNWDVL